jgi:hypothetical protein
MCMDMYLRLSFCSNAERSFAITPKRQGIGREVLAGVLTNLTSRVTVTEGAKADAALGERAMVLGTQ